MNQADQVLIVNSDQPTNEPSVLADSTVLGADRAVSAAAVTYIPSPVEKVRLHLVTEGIDQPFLRIHALAEELYQSKDGSAATAKGTPLTGFALLDHVPDWAYRCYEVEARQQGAFQSHIYLFNVVIALEWDPDPIFLEQLRWAFQQASDFLFDVTDGWMAFGQVIFGGAGLMESADIQIMASNRLHPRSWVGGLFEKEHHRPIRIGRGIWSDRQEVAFSWEEPEAYRIIVHEWGHYALYLTDEYLSPPKRIAEGSPEEFTIIVPQIVAGKESIMANTEGISELSSDAWATLRTRHYTRIPPRRRSRVGPQRVPGALPRFFLQKNWYKHYTQTADSPPVVIARQRSEEGIRIFSQLQDPVQFRHCWLYVLQGMNGQQPPKRIIAQGSLDAHSFHRNYPLLGAQPDDTVVLMSTPPDQPSTVLSGIVGRDGQIANWQPFISPNLPIIDIVPALDTDPIGHSQVYVRVRMPDGTRPTQVALFPIGQAKNQKGILLKEAAGQYWTSKPVVMPTLDGHVFVRSAGGIAITSFSQGGDPPFHNPAPENPINAGSADGNAMMFFYSEGIKILPAADSPYRQIKVVTTRIPSVPYADTFPAQTRVLSAAYSLASNAALPAELDPTLILYYNLPPEIMNLAALSQGAIQVYRLDGDQWVRQQQAFAPITRGSLFVAMPLYYRPEQHPGRSLVQDATDMQIHRSEAYVVCWSPDLG